jgi:hypothetical protein
MIEKKIEYRILEFILINKLNLYISILFLFLSNLYFFNTYKSWLFAIPIFLFYELIILLFNYNKNNKRLFYLIIVGLIIVLILEIYFSRNLYFLIGYIFLFSALNTEFCFSVINL